MTIITKNNGARQLPFDQVRLERFIDEVTAGFPRGEHQYPLKVDEYKEKVIRTIGSKSEYTADQITNLLIMVALENIDMAYHEWTYVAAEIYLRRL